MPDALPAIDFHTHNPAAGTAPDAGRVTRIASTAQSELSQPDTTNTFRTLELHPWYGEAFTEKFAELAATERFLAVGEVGLDRNRGKLPLDAQREIFRQCAALADAIGKPLIVHCVGCFAELLEEYKRQPWRVPTVLHYFCGKPELAQQLLAGRTNWYLSLPPLATKSARLMEFLRNTPEMQNRFVLETDDPAGDAEAHYQVMSEILARDLDELKSAMHQRFKEIFKR